MNVATTVATNAPRRRSLCLSLASMVIAGLWGLPAHAHRCGPSQITIQLGQCTTWEIVADVMESERSIYGLSAAPGPAASTAPGDPRVGFPFEKFNLGVYRICGAQAGSTTMTATWAYNPNMASGSCPLTIDVVSASSAPGSNGDGTTSGEDGDPVNTYSGELYELYEPDLRLDGPMPLVYQRYYSSQLARSGVREGRLGAGWLDNYSISFSGDADRIDVSYLFGQRLRFDRSGSDWILVSPAGSGFQLRAIGDDFALIDPVTQLRYTFDGGGRLSHIRDRNGNALSLGYDAAGEGELPISVSDGLGRSLSFTAAGFQLYDQLSDGTRTVDFNTVFATGSADHLASLVDAGGGSSSFAYADPFANVPGLMTALTRPEGNTPLTSSYDGQFRVVSQTDALASTWTFGYAAPDTMLGFPGGATAVHTHDASGRQIGITNNVNETKSIGYDASGRRDLIIDELGQSQSLSYDAASGAIASYTDASGATIDYSYLTRTDANGFSFRDFSAITFGDGRSYTFSRDTRGNLTGYTDPGGGAWSATVNARGQLLTGTNPLGGSTTRSYQADGMPATRTDPAGNTTSYAYDGLHRLQTLTHPDSSMRTFAWTATDRLAAITDELGHTTSYTYDANQRLVGETDAGGASRSFGYDAADRPTSVTDALGQTLTRGYDVAGRPSSDTRGNGESVGYGYDARGFLDTLTDPAGEVWSFGNDALGRLVSMTDPTGAVTGFTLDPLGRITGIDWPAGGSETFAYDAMGRLLAHADAEDRATTYRRAAAGWLAGIDVVGASLDTTYNAMGLLTAIEDPSGNDWTWAYDSSGRLDSFTDPLGAVTSYDYDNRNRWSGIVYPSGLGSETLTYDARNQLLERDFSDGTLIEYGYDDAGRLTGGTGYSASFDGEGRMTASNGLGIARQPATGRIASVTWVAGPTASYDYDAGGRLVGIDDGLGGTTGFGYDDAGRITSITRPNGVSSSFAYDGNGRLSSVTHGSFVDLAIERDRSGFVATVVRDQPTHYQVPVANLDQSANAALGITGLAHDALGRVSSDGSLAYTHDLASRLDTRTNGASMAAYAWDALYHLVARSEAGVTQGFVWNYGTRQPSVATTTVGGAAQWYYVSLPEGRLLYRIQAGTNARQYYHFDETGNALAITDEGGSVIASYGYAPYGRRTEAGGVSDNPFTFGGEHFVVTDAGQRLYVMGARLYDAERMRFVSRDRVAPALHPLAFNPYPYAAGNPLYFIDPWGDNPEAAGGASAGDVAGELNGALSGAGTVQGVVEEAAQSNLNSARQTTGQLGRQFAQGGQAANQARGPLNTAVQTQNNAQRALNQASSRGMKALGNLGNAATFVGGLVEAYKLNGKLNQHESSWSRNVQNAFEDAETASENAFRSYKRGYITEETLRSRLATIQDLLEDRLENEQGLYNINVAISGADAVFNFGMGLAPGGDKLYSGLKSLLGVEVP